MKEKELKKKMSIWASFIANKLSGRNITLEQFDKVVAEAREIFIRLVERQKKLQK